VTEPEPGRGWAIFAVLRRLVVFLLGVVVVVSALIDPDSQHTVPMLIIGMVMVGVLPIDDLFGWRRRRD
jgi:hypothetical protein